jgi:hypothetical protein
MLAGLFNGDNLNALKGLGYVAAVGDNTLPYLVNPDNRYHTKLTSVDTSNVDGYIIIPRDATGRLPFPTLMTVVCAHMPCSRSALVRHLVSRPQHAGCA